MSWTSISDLALELAPLAREVPTAAPIREAAAEVAVRRWGPAGVAGLPTLVNVAALAVSAARGRLLVHRVRPAAAALVDSTDLHSLPAEPPRLLRRPWILEARRPETGERLFGETAALAGYQVDGVTYLIGLSYPDGARVARWTPRWTGGELDAGIPAETSPLIDDADTHHAWVRDAARFAIVLGLLLDAEGAPLRTEDQVGAGTRRPGYPARLPRALQVAADRDDLAGPPGHRRSLAGAGAAAPVVLRARRPCDRWDCCRGAYYRLGSGPFVEVRGGEAKKGRAQRCGPCADPK